MWQRSTFSPGRSSSFPGFPGPSQIAGRSLPGARALGSPQRGDRAAGGGRRIGEAAGDRRSVSSRRSGRWRSARACRRPHSRPSSMSSARCSPTWRRRGSIRPRGGVGERRSPPVLVGSLDRGRAGARAGCAARPGRGRPAQRGVRARSPDERDRPRNDPGRGSDRPAALPARTIRCLEGDRGRDALEPVPVAGDERADRGCAPFVESRARALSGARHPVRGQHVPRMGRADRGGPRRGRASRCG